MIALKRIVEGKLYDTGTAKIVAKWRWSSEGGQGDKTLYINKNGAFFVMDEDAPEYDGDVVEPRLTPHTRDQVANFLLHAEKLEVLDGSYSDICWYGPFPIAPLIQVGGSSLSPQASRARRQPR